jgi:hypothetical protein
MNVKYCSIMSYCIYKIVCDDLPDFVYVGSTKVFRSRKSQHKQNCNNGCTQKLYTTIRENGGWDNWRMVIIEECGEITLIQARIKEEENRLKLNANMNMKKCYRTEEELKEQRKEFHKQYREANKEDIKEYKKEYNKQYREANKEKIKEYREANKEYHQEYWEVNKEKINEHKNQKITCECGRNFSLGGKARHLRTNVHINFINNNII